MRRKTNYRQKYKSNVCWFFFNFFASVRFCAETQFQCEARKIANFLFYLFSLNVAKTQTLLRNPHIRYYRPNEKATTNTYHLILFHLETYHRSIVLSFSKIHIDRLGSKSDRERDGWSEKKKFVYVYVKKMTDFSIMYIKHIVAKSQATAKSKMNWKWR